MAQFRALSDRTEIPSAARNQDVRKWEVRTRVDGERAGEVEEVLLDEDGVPRYLDIDLEGDRHVLLPIGEAEADPGAEVIYVPGLDRAGLKTLPAYEHSPESITPEYSRSVATAHREAYRDEYYHDRADYGAAWAGTGGGAATGELGRLDELDDVKVASHDPDPRGWEVVDAEGATIGRVDHLIGDTGAMKVRYLTVVLDDDLSPGHERVLMPAGHVDLDPGNDRVVARSLERSRVAGVPSYGGGAVDRAYEARVTRAYDEAYRDDRLYEHPRYRSRGLEPRR